MNRSQTNRLLGYPADARLLLINADDFGMCHAINEAIFRTLTEGLVRSTSLMMPCPWALHTMHLLSEHPDISFGVPERVGGPSWSRQRRAASHTTRWGTGAPDGFRFFDVASAQDIVKEEGIILVNYRPLQAVWSAA